MPAAILVTGPLMLEEHAAQLVQSSVMAAYMPGVRGPRGVW
jgi:hypothetical protein